MVSHQPIVLLTVSFSIACYVKKPWILKKTFNTQWMTPLHFQLALPWMLWRWGCRIRQSRRWESDGITRRSWSPWAPWSGRGRGPSWTWSLPRGQPRPSSTFIRQGRAACEECRPKGEGGCRVKHEFWKLHLPCQMLNISTKLLARKLQCENVAERGKQRAPHGCASP